jgi:RimJ/RimL family protein N-acetyltransferase
MYKITNYFQIKKDGKEIGRVNLVCNGQYPQIEYDLNEEYWNQGIMTKAVKEYLQIIKNKFPKIIALVKDKNHASQKVLEKNGFVKVTTFNATLTYIIDLEASEEKQKIMRELIKSGKV